MTRISEVDQTFASKFAKAFDLAPQGFTGAASRR